MTPSARALWDRYRALHPDAPEQPYESFHFCDNQQDADICADLVVRGIKRATAAQHRARSSDRASCTAASNLKSP